MSANKIDPCSDTSNNMSHQAPPPYSDVPPPYGFQQPPPQQQGNVILVAQPAMRTVIITPMSGLGPNPLQTNCPSCLQMVHSRVEQEIASRAHLSALLLCLFGCWPCVCLPYCMESCRNTNHFCPNCNAYIGTYAA